MPAGEGEQACADLFQAVHHGTAIQSPFGQGQPALAHHLGASLGIDHVVIVGGDFLVRHLRRMSEQIAMLMRGAARVGSSGQRLARARGRGRHQ